MAYKRRLYFLKNMSRKSTEEIITYFTGFKNMNQKLDLDK